MKNCNKPESPDDKRGKINLKDINDPYVQKQHPNNNLQPNDKGIDADEDLDDANA